jgi:2-oxopent-4-enoate/cis-2-oxohex-4-enoate hydratase
MIPEIARSLFDAMQNARPLAPLSQTWPGLTGDDAYEVQKAFLSHRNGSKVGYKIGLTNPAVQHQLGVSEPDYGVLLDTMEVPHQGLTSARRLIAPRIEGELAFVLGEDLDGPDISARDVMTATALIYPSLEIVDSRILDWKITIVDTVADNASAGQFVLGPKGVRPEDVDFELAGVTLRINGAVESTGTTGASLGNPLHAVAWLARTMHARKSPLRKGDLLLSGALCPMVAVRGGMHVHLDICGVGTAAVRFSDEPVSPGF